MNGSMRINLMIEPQEGMTYSDILSLVRHAEDLGFEGVYRSDHYTSVFGRVEVGSTDAWATLAGLVRETERIVLGTLISPATFRPAANLAKVVATVAGMAGSVRHSPDGPSSRVHLGMGTGWLAVEHDQYGFPFGDLGTRFRRLEEHLQVVRGLWDPAREPFTFEGEFEQVRKARFAPRPDPPPRVIVGGRGRLKTVPLAVRYADELNCPSATPEECRELRGVLDDACKLEERDPSTMGFSLMTPCVVGATEKEFRARVGRLEALAGSAPGLVDYLDRVAVRGVIGAPEQAADRLGRLAEAGVERVMLQHLLYDDLEMLDLVAEEIAPSI